MKDGKYGSERSSYYPPTSYMKIESEHIVLLIPFQRMFNYSDTTALEGPRPPSNESFFI